MDFSLPDRPNFKNQVSVCPVEARGGGGGCRGASPRALKRHLRWGRGQASSPLRSSVGLIFLSAPSLPAETYRYRQKDWCGA